MPEVWLQDFEKRTTATLEWVERSIKVTGYKGSAGYFHLWLGWSPAYPETTGYLIETLFDYANYLEEEKYKNLAIACADWLCSIQRPDGAFPGGLGETGEPVVFDTGQILFGLIAAWRRTVEAKYKTALERAVIWLLENLEPDGSWKKYSYVFGYIPAYYTRVVWAVLAANEILQQVEVTDKMRKAIEYYAAQVQPNGAVKNWAFAHDELAYTHTIAYTLRGFLECGALLNDQQLLTKARFIGDRIVELYKIHQKIAGRYDENWRGDYGFECVTGNAQLAIAFARLYQLSGDENYFNIAKKIFSKTVHYQKLMPLLNLYGAIPGSAPIWGAYQRFSFPNWAAKFYLDAFLILKKLEDERASA